MGPKRRGGVREATCRFADVIQQAAESAGQALGVAEEGGRYCLAAFLLTRYPGAVPEVVALGAGTKFLSASLVAEDASHGVRVHDSHAEPLARRALLKWLHLQIHALLTSEKGPASEAGPPLETESVPGARQPADALPSCVLQRLPDGGEGQGLMQLVPGAALHLYCSSCPCGNATLRRWAQAGKGGDASLGEAAAALPEHDWPVEVHPLLSLHAVREGQVQLLLKRDPEADSKPTKTAPSLDGGPADDGGGEGGGETHARVCERPGGEGSANNDGRSAVSCGRSGLVPPGTVPPGSPGAGVMLSCSDKVALWNALGVQGALLSCFLCPIRPATITVQRKFSRPHLCRALCCRLGKWRAGNGAGGVAHPTLLSPTCTRVFDGAGEEEESEQPAFGSGLATCWWAGATQAVRLNGRTGLPWQAEGSGSSGCGCTLKEALEADAVGVTMLEALGNRVSPICKLALFDAYTGLRAAAGMHVPGGDGIPWAQRYRQAKQEACPAYDAAREELLSSPLYFIPAEGTAGHPSGAKRRVSTGYRRKGWMSPTDE